MLTAPVLVVVPDLVGAGKQEAKQALTAKGLKPGTVSGTGGRVHSQDPHAGTTVLPGSPVDFDMGTAPAPVVPAPDPLVAVPNLASRTVYEARVALTAVGLVLGGNDSAGNRRVESQAPAAGTLVRPGSAVTVTVSEATMPVASDLIPWWLLVGALILLAVILGGLLVSHPLRDRQGQKWVRVHVRAVVGAAPGTVIEVMESRTDRSPPTCVVRLEPHSDSGTQVLHFEEVAP